MKPIPTALLVLILLFVAGHPARAESVYSVDSLKILCGTVSVEGDSSCRIYLHGVVETWMLKDLVALKPRRYQARGREPAFCETILKVSDDEWLRIVRSSLPDMEPGIASLAVSKALAANLCEQ